jgi:high frequency lysogenization protein
MSTRHQVMALAGVFQAASLARSVAADGRADQDPLTTSIDSLFLIDAESVESVYGGVAGLRLGLETLVNEFGEGRPNPEIIQYAMGLLTLERKLSGRRDMQFLIREGISHAHRQAEHLGRTHESVLHKLGDVYVSTISTMRPRVIVRGKPLYLQQARLVGQIRAILLAGIRSAVLWGQLGGSRLKLVFRRRTLAEEAQRLLATIQA